MIHLLIKRIVGFRAGSEKAVCYYQFYVKMWQLFSFLWNVSLLALIAKWKITHKMISFNDLKKFPMEKYINGKPNIKENQFHTAFPKLCVYHQWPKVQIRVQIEFLTLMRNVLSDLTFKGERKTDLDLANIVRKWLRQHDLIWDQAAGEKSSQN